MAPDPDVMRFYARAAQGWLDLEMPGVRVCYEAPNRLRLGEEFELRLLPDDCRWQLRRRSGRGARLWPPSRPCVSLVDWLAQVRRVHNLTDKAGTAGPQKESKTQI